MKFLLVFPFGWFDSYMYRDLILDDRVSVFYLDKPMENTWLHLLRRVHHSCKINQAINLPGKGLWNKRLLDIIDADTCVMFNTGALSLIDNNLLTKIKNKAAKLVLLIVDSIHANSQHLKVAKPMLFSSLWDLILSYDKNDCAEFGFGFLGQSYYSVLGDVKKSLKTSDIYYVGREKLNRNENILALQKFLVKNNIKCNFNLVDSPRNKNKYNNLSIEGLTVSFANLPYEQIVSDIKSANCILEVVQEGQNVQTARYFEAVCYNKKLLTNNHIITKLPFYNPKYMKCFNSYEDIDLEWIKREEKIDFGYNKEFSPLKILEIINSYFGWT